MTAPRHSLDPHNGAAPSGGGLFRARLTVFSERLWPALLPALGMLALFVLITLFDLWRFMPWVLHYAVLGMLAGLSVFFLIRDLKNLEWPSREEGMARLEADGKVPHAALRSREDRPFAGEAGGDSPLWRAHLERMNRLARGARLGKSHATADRRDPYALRYGAALALVVGLFVAWGDIVPRFWNAVSPRPASSIPAVVDLWIDPPAYTGRPPVILVQSGPAPDGRQQTIAVPQGSVLHARIAGTDRRGPGSARLEVETQEGRTRPDLSRTDISSADLSRGGTSLTGETVLSDNAALSLSVNGRRASWPVLVVPDEVPTIEFARDPAADGDGRITVAVEIGDDYGITEAEALIELVPDQERPLDTPAISLDPTARETRIPVGGLTGAYGVRSTSLDLTDHPWAGLEVSLKIVARDGAGQDAATMARRLTLPEREFFNPLARAIIHERRNLAVAPQSWPATSRSLDALTFAPDRFFDRPTDYLMLRAAYWSVMHGRGENTEDVVEDMWPLALQLEDQELELARRALEAAREALREALERGADQSEVEGLIEDLRMAMQNYIQALAESGQAMAEDGQNSQELGSRDLDDILDSISDLSGSGANNAARQLLSELEQMLDNLRISQGGSGSGSGSAGQGSGQPSGEGNGSGQQNGAGGEAAQRTGDLIARQRDLADDTYDADRRNSGIPGERPGGASSEELRQRQSELTGDVEALLDRLQEGTGRGGGQDGRGQGGEEAARSFREARQRMQDAADALANGNLSAAGTFQEEALNALREGADGISDSIMQAQQEGENGENGQAAGARAGGAPAQLDPLGRPYGAPAPGGDVGIPDLSDPESARELILELRRKLSEPGRSEEEIEYLERLLERF